MTAPARERVVQRVSAPQRAILDCPARFVVAIAGRRFGKSYVAVLRQLRKALRTPGLLCWYIAPTRDMAKDIAWELYKKLAAPWTLEVNESDLAILLVNGSRLRLFSADRPDRLVGRAVDDVVCDEFEQMDRGVWEVSLRPSLATTGGGALFISTPRGLGWGYDLVQHAAAHPGEWAHFHFTTLQGGRVPAAEVAAARADLDARLFRQEYEASFEMLANRVYDAWDRTANLDATLTDAGGDVLVGLDFNVHPMSAVIGVRAGDELHILDALQVPTSNTTEVAEELRRRFRDRRVVVCPDPSGQSRRTSAPVGQTDFTILRAAGFAVVADRAAPPVVDRVNNVQAMLASADGRRRLRVHPKAAALVRSLDGLTYKAGTSVPDKSSGLDHMADALGYLCWQEFNVLRRRAGGVFKTGL